MRTKTMGDKSKIDWCDATWNFTVGCSKVSAGCKHCYAERLAARLVRMQPESVYEGTVDKAGRWTGQININEKALALPLRWKAPRSIFVNSMSDLLHESLSFGQVMRAFNVMAQANQHSYIVLTKRPERLLEFARTWVDLAGETETFRNARGPAATRKHHPSGRGQLFADMLEAMGPKPEGCAYPTFDWMEGMRWWPDAFPHIYWGFSAEDQHTFDRRWAIMREVASLGWKVVVSLEPLLGKIELLGEINLHRPDTDPSRTLHGVIVGGESGGGARPMQPDWVRSIRDDCEAAGVKFFFKQWGAWCPDSFVPNRKMLNEPRFGDEQNYDDVGYGSWRLGKKASGRELDGRTHDELPWTVGLAAKNAQNTAGVDHAQLLSDIAANLPDDAIAGIPTDGATQHDHYLYGTTKKNAEGETR